MPTHTINITTFGREYQTSGAVALRVASNPMKAAAQALLEGGAAPHDMLTGAFDGVSISPASLHSIARAYTPPRAAWGPSRDAERALSA
jgi:hypothetical protein